MNYKKLIEHLQDYFDFKDCYVDKFDLQALVIKNYDEISQWDHYCIMTFVGDVCQNGFEKACRLNGLSY